MTTETNPAIKFAVVTGASQGLGKAFSTELAKKNINLILVSLPGQDLELFSNEISAKYQVQTAFFETDLSITANVLQLAETINKSFNVHLLINNAGMGGTQKFVESKVDYINTIMQVNVVATSILTHQLLPNLMQQVQSYILNVSSMAAFSPIGFKTVYPASKAFVHSFSRGLREELRDTNVFVSVVNPGGMRTNGEIKSRIDKLGFIGKLTLLEPEYVAKVCVRQLFRKKSVIIVNPISWAIMHLLPVWIKLPLLTRTIKKEIG